MNVILRKRHYGVHDFVKEIDIIGNFNDYVQEKTEGIDSFEVKEQLLIENLPEDFLPTSPKNILLIIDNGKYGTGLYGVNLFRKWSKYFDSYALELVNEIGGK